MIDMTPDVTLVVTAAVLVTVGVYLLLERSLSRVVVGIILIGNGVNLLILVAGGAAGRPPILGGLPGATSDPLPQAMVLTAIVITLGLTAFLLAMAYRSWQLNRHDEVQDDVEDRRIARLAARDRLAVADLDADDTSTLEQEAEEARDETDRPLGLVVGDAGPDEPPVADTAPSERRTARPSGGAREDHRLDRNDPRDRGDRGDRRDGGERR